MNKFELGQTVVTRAVADWMEGNIAHQAAINNIIYRHASGDWGEVGLQDKLGNDDALIHGDRLLSVYTIEDTKFWVITEADRSATTVLFPSDY